MTETHEYTEAESGYDYAYGVGYDYGTEPTTEPETKTLSPVGDIATAALAAEAPPEDPSLAQALARRGRPPQAIQSASGVSASVAQALHRTFDKTT